MFKLVITAFNTKKQQLIFRIVVVRYIYVFFVVEIQIKNDQKVQI